MQMPMPTVGSSNTFRVKKPLSSFSCPMVASMYSLAATPSTMPMYPKKVVMQMLSTMIRRRIDQGLAPMALRMPNSCVRSLTVMSMMLETPTMPEMSVRMPIIHSAVRIIVVPVFICRFCVKRFHIHIEFSSSGAASCRRLTRER